MRPGMLPLLQHPRRSQYTPNFKTISTRKQIRLIIISDFLKSTKDQITIHLKFINIQTTHTPKCYKKHHALITTR